MTSIAVVDVETTGLNLYRNDRIVELAAVVVQPNGTVVRDFVSLVNPERDIGPTHIHHLTARDVFGAPRFGEIAGEFLEVVAGCVAIAGHNVRFDRSFLESEFDRLGYQFPQVPALCTMQLCGGGSLEAACMCYGVDFGGPAHSAWHDARATATLLGKLLADAPRLVSQVSSQPSIRWPRVPRSGAKVLRRGDSTVSSSSPPRYLQRLVSRAIPPSLVDNDESAVGAYVALLSRVLEDCVIDEREEEALVEVATQLGLSRDGVLRIHRDYLRDLAALAIGDGVITGEERRNLGDVASLLGIDSQILCATLLEVESGRTVARLRSSSLDASPTCSDLIGKRVCFTGECQCRLVGCLITREQAMEIAEAHGMEVAESVTKRLDVLVVADPLTQSGKAKKARQYGIRIIHEPVFWRNVGMPVE